MNPPDASAAHPQPSPPAARTATVRTRLWGAVVFTAAAAPLAVAVWLKPSATGYGTHRQFGAAPCGVLVRTGLPCPTCGMTTAFALAVRGRWIRAFLAQPAGLALALAIAAAALLGLRALLTGRDAAFLFRWVSPYRLFLSLLVILLAGWGFKLAYGILSGELPMPPAAIWKSG